VGQFLGQAANHLVGGLVKGATSFFGNLFTGR
jgi:hypothetical protein